MLFDKAGASTQDTLGLCGYSEGKILGLSSSFDDQKYWVLNSPKPICTKKLSYIESGDPDL